VDYFLVFLKDLFWDPLLFIAFINKSCDAINHSTYLLFADNIETYRASEYPEDCNILA
jgi:hypothetical protein